MRFALYLSAHEKHFACMKKAMPRSFMARVRASLPDLHPSERRLAEAVLDFPGDMAGYSASEIAELAGVSNATVSRFVRKIGYGSYDEARKAVREEGRTGAALLRFGTADGTKTGAVAAHLEQSRLNLEKTYEALDTAAVDHLALSGQRRGQLAPHGAACLAGGFPGRLSACKLSGLANRPGAAEWGADTETG